MKIPTAYISPDDKETEHFLGKARVQISQMERWVEDLLDHIKTLESKLDQINHISKY